ncbi:MAG: excinuclease ABC subunit UvrA [Bacteroidales bacterium]|nr:excinuclease ABC subunit UvrA [Bacteroidales bacterium]
MEEGFIKIKKAEVNNLKGIDVEIPRNKFTVITGISGSGKSSLAFETLFAEGQRRFAESLSSFARQFLGRMSKPAVESIIGIPPAIAIEQKVNTRNPRSTVGSTTEIYDYLRTLYAKIGRTISPVSGEEVRCDTTNSVLEALKEEAQSSRLPSESVVYILSDIKWSQQEYRIERLVNLKEEGFSRMYIESEDGTTSIERIDRILTNIDSYTSKNVMLLIDRSTIGSIAQMDNELETSLTDSITTAFNKGNGYITIIIDTLEEKVVKQYSNIFERDGILFETPSEWIFNYNSPLGACPNCGGYGKLIGIDESLVVPNQALSVFQDAIACWKGDVMRYFKEEVILNAEKIGFPIHTPYKELTREQKDLLWNGNKYITGITPFFKELESKRYKIQNKYMISRYSGKTTCRECEGSRLRRESLYVKIGGKDINELLSMSIKDLLTFFKELKLTEYEQKVGERAIREIVQRLEYINDVGLSYLTLNRASNTLSGGESQRISLVKSLGNSLTGSMYILDEPSIGLHSRDTQRLISVIKNLRDLGNTVIVVEHDEEIIRAADYLIDIGPNAGKHGGEVVYAGPTPTEDLTQQYPKSLTLKYLSGVSQISLNNQKRIPHDFIEICDCCENNLKNIDVKFPLNVITAVTGVSGSGKSTLVGDILYPALNRHLNQVGPKPGSFRELRGRIDKITAVEFVDQNPIGKSSRSNPATYIKVYDDIRKLFSEQPYAKMNGYGHSHFSFNIDGGRCPECLGEGTIKIPMQFMADITMTCESCGGKRFIHDILEVKYQGKNISDILDMSVDDAIEFFGSQENPAAKKIARKLQPLHDVGLGYIALGQNSSTLSGGESQRVKLAYFLGKENSEDNAPASKPILFIFDEPTTGLHFDDIEKLIKSFDALINKGHTIIVVEHNPYIIEYADYIIELGPEGGAEGGYLLTPQP